MNCLGLIIARGGSKRIPRKNVMLLGGKPLIAWTIEEALKVPSLSRIIVSTDDEEIAQVAREYGAEVPFMRPISLAQDLTPDLPVFEHALMWLKDNEGVIPEMVAHLRATGPLRTTDDMERGIQLLTEHPDYDSVRAVIPAPLHPMKTYRLEANDLIPFIPDEVYGIPEPYNAPVQSLPKAYAAAGYFSAIWSRTVLEHHSMTGKRILGYVCAAEHATDIDTELDFQVAEARLAAREVR